MARPLRLEFAGAIYHVTSRGDRREDIYADDIDRQAWLDTLAQCCQRFNWVVHSWCQMTNHYHLVIETVEGNLSAGMRQLNGVYTQNFNRRHTRVGHVFQGRFKAILVDRDAYLLELARYVVLNPVRAGVVQSPGQWTWSAYQSYAGQKPAPKWLNTEWTLAQFASSHATDKGRRREYERFVAQGVNTSSVWSALKGQVFLGDDAFVEAMQRRATEQSRHQSREIPKAQRRAVAKSLAYYRKAFEDRGEGICAAYATGDFTQAQIAQAFEVHYATVSRIIGSAEKLSSKA